MSEPASYNTLLFLTPPTSSLTAHAAAPLTISPLRPTGRRYAHMSAPAKWFFELKAFLYSWLRTGVEPL